MTRMDHTPKSDCHLLLKYMIGFLQIKVVNKRTKTTEENGSYVGLEGNNQSVAPNENIVQNHLNIALLKVF